MEGASSSRTYYYARVSSTDQNLARQLEAFKRLGATDREIITDMKSGKDTDRPAYKTMRDQMLHKGDTLVVTSLDRLSRRKADIKRELEYYLQNGIRVKVLDLPTTLMEWLEGSDLMQNTIATLIIEMYGMMAEQERLNIRKRQREGLDAMGKDDKGRRISTKKGTHAGRPDIQRPANWEEVTAAWRAGTITAAEAMKRTGMKRTSFYKLAAADKGAEK